MNDEIIKKDVQQMLANARLGTQNVTQELSDIDVEIRKLIRFRDMMEDIPTCNDCWISSDCGVRPNPGELVRYNCHLYIGSQDV